MPDCFAVTIPMENVNDETATIVEWSVPSGSEVKKGEVIVALETMKATFEMEAEEEGFLFYEAEEGEELSIGSPIAYICRENRKPEFQAAPAASETGEELVSGTAISAKAEKLMKEHGLKAEDFAGLEKVKLADVKARISEMRSAPGAESPAAAKKQNLPSHNSVKIGPAKKFEIQQLSQSNRRVNVSSVSMMFDMTKIEKKAKELAETEGVQATVSELIIFEISRLLKKHSLFNGFYDDGTCNVYDEVNIGFAVNIGKGLKVPVIKNADNLSLKDISSSVKDLSLKYFREELGMEDLSGGTFTVTDLSAKGIIDFNPVINNMQSSILGVCAVMPDTNYFKVILTFDHNMADGMVAADMLNELSTLLHG